MPTRPALLISFVCTMSIAHAATGGGALSLTHGGYLLDGADAPITGTLTLSFGVFPGAAGGVAEWTGTCAGVAVRGGYYAVDVGGAGCTGTGGIGDSVLDTSDLPGTAPRWLEVKVGVVTLEPRLALAGIVGAGSTQLSTLGTITAGTWQATPIADAFVAGASGWNAKISAVVHDATLTGAGTAASPLGLGTDGSALQNVNAAKLGGLTLAELQSSIASAAGGQANAGSASPGACSPGTTGLLWFDTTNAASPTLKVCNGAYYVALGGAVSAPPGPPAAPVSTISDQAVSLTWGGVSGATAYQVGWSLGTSLQASPTIVAAAGTSATISGLVNEQTYTFAVRTIANAFTSAWSTPVQAVPAAIRTLVAFGTGKRWSDGTYALNCKGYRSPVYPYTYGGATGDGLYTIDPDGAGTGAPFDAYCDMGRWNGGWTLVFRLAGVNFTDNTAADLPPTPAKTRAKFASSVINQISRQSAGSAYEMILEGPVTQTLMRASEPFYVEMNTWPVVVEYDCDKNGVYEKTKTWNAWYTDRGASEGSTWVRDWVYPQAGQCNAWNGGNVLQYWAGTATVPGTGTNGSPIHATAGGYAHNGSVFLWVR